MLGGGKAFIPCVFYTIEGVFFDIIINIDYLIEFQVPAIKYSMNVQLGQIHYPTNLL